MKSLLEGSILRDLVFQRNAISYAQYLHLVQRRNTEVSLDKLGSGKVIKWLRSLICCETFVCFAFSYADENCLHVDEKSHGPMLFWVNKIQYFCNKWPLKKAYVLS
ncbi:Coiled-coil domain-containing protein [Trichinella pseudospiralis]